MINTLLPIQSNPVQSPVRQAACARRREALLDMDVRRPTAEKLIYYLLTPYLGRYLARHVRDWDGNM